MACVCGLAHGQDATEPAATLTVDAVAKNFKLPGLGEEPVELDELLEQGPVVVVVLRGWPGYQCPACAKQFASFSEHAKEFLELKATVVFIYPGPEADLRRRAEEFLRSEKPPEPFVIALDPGYKFTTIWNLRWDAPNETAYPSTFILDAERKIRFRKVSKTHGDRAEAEDVLAALRGE
jgi:peroxiredoxin